MVVFAEPARNHEHAPKGQHRRHGAPASAAASGATVAGSRHRPATSWCASAAPCEATLAERYLPLARNLAWEATRLYGIPFDDALSDAFYGLARAIRRVDLDRQSQPAGYFGICIRGEIKRGIRDRSGYRSFYERGGEEANLAELWNLIESVVDERSSRALRLRYVYGLTQKEIAPIIGCSQVHVSRILNEARARLAPVLAA